MNENFSVDGFFFRFKVFLSYCYSYLSAFLSANYNHGQNIWEKLWFLCEIAHYEKSSISIFKESFASIDKILFLGGRLGTRLYFHEVLTLFWTFLIS